jgi:PPM family protein phosphatase
MTLILRYAARSDRGLIRDGNQDSVYAGPRLLAVADGMGGMAAGDVASNIVIGAMASLDEDVPGDALVDALRASVEVANQQLRDTVEANPHLEGMGTTLTAMLFTGSKIGMAHIGDSRAYLLRDGEFGQITKDDTYVQMLVDEGRISAEEASSHPQRSLLTRALDGRDIDPEYSVRQVILGDRYLICSDGLSGVVSAETIGQTLKEYTDPQQCVERLVALALRGGGPDNVTVIVADATDEGIVEQVPMVGGAAAADRGETHQGLVESTPAARASALAANTPRPASPTSEIEPTASASAPSGRRGPLRTVLLLVVLLTLLGGGVWALWNYSQSQYYIGANADGYVAIYQGVPGQIAGFDLSQESQTSGMLLNHLTKQAQEQVRRGIQADNLADAQRRLADLTSDDPDNVNLLPSCNPSVEPTESPAESPSVDPTATAGVPVDGAVSPSNDPVVPSPVPCRSN